MFTLAIQAGKLRDKPYIPMLREDNVRRGFFEAAHFESVRARLPAALQGVATFAYITGWRMRSEILPLEWRQVDWAGRMVRLEPGTTKNREGRSFPFTVALETLLKAQLVDHERLKKAGTIVPWVFFRMKGPRKGPHELQRIRNFRRAWLSACKGAGVPGRIPHHFRRTAVRNLERAGVPRSAAMGMVGHKNGIRLPPVWHCRRGPPARSCVEVGSRPRGDGHTVGHNDRHGRAGRATDRLVFFGRTGAEGQN
jgi:integrase